MLLSSGGLWAMRARIEEIDAERHTAHREPRENGETRMVYHPGGRWDGRRIGLRSRNHPVEGQTSSGMMSGLGKECFDGPEDAMSISSAP